MHIFVHRFRMHIQIVHFRVQIQNVHFRAQISRVDFVRGFRPYVSLAGVFTLTCDALYCVYHCLAVNPCFLAALALSTLSL